MKTIKTHCYLCNCRCGIVASVEGDRIVKVEGDPDCQKNEGSLCIRGRAMLEFMYDKDRLRYPLQREGGSWKRVSWDDAIEKISARLQRIKSSHGAEAVGFFRGMSVYSWLIPTYLKRFANLYGSPNFFSNAAICIGPMIYANKYTFGPGISTCGDFRRSKCILLFGTNPAVTGMHRALRVMKDILHAKKEGAKLIVVDPKHTATAAKADIYTSIKPGTDAALVLSLLNVIIENDWYDRSFVERHTVGFQELKKLVKEYTPERVEKITWVDKNTITEIARVFAQTKPACADRREGIFHHENSTQSCRAINFLNIITGNIDVAGGCVLQKNLYGKGTPLYKKLTCAELGKPKRPSISAHNPFTQDMPTDLIKAIVDEEPYPIKALIVFGCNPLLSWPNTSRVLEALKKLEFMLVVDVYRNETASFADFALPAATFLEKMDLSPPNVAIPKIIQLQQKVVEPLYESRPEMWIIRRLAQSMGYGDRFQDSDEEILDRILSQWELTVGDLEKNESGFDFEPRPLGSFREKGFGTPSGKIEIYSEEMKRMGEAPLPEFREPTLSSRVIPEITQQYPLCLVTGNRVSTTYLSFLHNLPSLHKLTPRDWVEIHPDAAASRGIKDKEAVIVESPKGRITSVAKVNEKIDPRIIVIPYGWGHKFGASWQLANSTEGECVNYLLDDSLIDKISGVPNYKSVVCEVRKKD